MKYECTNTDLYTSRNQNYTDMNFYTNIAPFCSSRNNFDVLEKGGLKMV